MTAAPQSFQQRVEPLRQLLPCPLCGEKRIFLNEPSQWHRYGSINCPACLLVLPGEVSDKKELINCWNERAPLASQDVPSAISSPTQSMDIWQAYAAAQDEIAALRRERATMIEALFEPRESDAIDNLEGALIDIRRLSEAGKPTDAVCIRTLERIQIQLINAHCALQPATPATGGQHG